MPHEVGATVFFHKKGGGDAFETIGDVASDFRAVGCRCCLLSLILSPLAK